MKVKDLIDKLKQFDENLEVTICDGYEAIVYQTNGIEIVLYEDCDKKLYVDIGIG